MTKIEHQFLVKCGSVLKFCAARNEEMVQWLRASLLLQRTQVQFPHPRHRTHNHLYVCNFRLGGWGLSDASVVGGLLLPHSEMAQVDSSIPTR